MLQTTGSSTSGSARAIACPSQRPRREPSHRKAAPMASMPPGDWRGRQSQHARSASTVFISEDTVRRGWETVRDRYREKYFDRAQMGILTFSDLEITSLSRDWAVALG